MTLPPGTEIVGWLRGLGLGEYADKFISNNVDMGILLHLTAEDLKEIGVASVGHRRKLVTAIEGLSRAGTVLPAPAIQTPTANGSLERRMLTVMFCDLVASTNLSVAMDPEDLRDFIHGFRLTVKAAVAPYGAYMAQYVGDGILAYFGYPNSSEFDAERAVEAALSVVQDVRHKSRIAAPCFEVRIGLATGMVVVGGIDGAETAQNASTDDAFGETINLAARLQSLAEPNGIVITHGTRALIGEMFRCRDLGQHFLKGFSTPVQAWEVLSRHATPSRFDALRLRRGSLPFVGRVGEIAMLREARNTLGEDKPRFFCVVGEAGIGKSRLVREALAGDGHGVDPNLILQCSPYQVNTPFYPLSYLIQRVSGVSTSDPQDRRVEELRATLEEVEPYDNEKLAVIADALGLGLAEDGGLRRLDSDKRRVLAMQHLTAFVIGMLRRRPILVIEDAQWIDASTAELLEKVFARIAQQSALVVVTSRLGPVPRWLERERVISIQLDRLPPEDTKSLVRQIMPDASAEDRPIQIIVERSGGIPIFAEELARGYVDGLAHDSAENLLANIPTTLSESLMDRLDRLRDGRRLVSIAAAIGREFPIDLLVSVSGLPKNIVLSGLEELQSAGIIMPGYSPFGPAISFRHMLIQDAAYQLLLKKDRRQLHSTIVATMRNTFPSMTKEIPHILAFQLSRAGMPEESAREWLRAGIIASGKSAYGEAVRHLRSGLDAIAALPETEERNRLEISLRTTLIGALIPLEGYRAPTVQKEMNLTLAASAKFNATDSVMLALYSKWVALGSSTNLKGALELAEYMCELAVSGRDLDKLIGWRSLSTSLLRVGRLQDAIMQYRNFMKMYDSELHGEALRTMHGDFALMVMLGLAEAHALRGEAVEAASWRSRVLEMGLGSGRAHDQGHILVYAGCLHPLLTGDMAEAALGAEQLLRLVEEHDLVAWRGHALLFGGLANIRAGAPEHGFRRVREGIAEIKRNAFDNVWFVLTADACVEHSFLDEATLMLDYARPLLEQGDLRFAALFHSVAARLAVRLGDDPATILSHLDQGKQIALQQGAALFLHRLMEQYAAHEADSVMPKAPAEASAGQGSSIPCRKGRRPGDDK